VRMVRALRADWAPNWDSAEGRPRVGVRHRVGALVGSPIRHPHGHAPGVSTAEARKIRELEREVGELRRAVVILRRAATFFGADLDRQYKK